jgi:RimJ/RimL family protein N-acetyltransferase
VSELPVPDPPFGDDVVHLRRWRTDDVSALYAAFSDPTVQRFSWPKLRPYSEADAREFLAGQEEGRARGTELELAAVTPDGRDLLLGCVSLYAIDRDQGRAAVGYWLAPDARGRGIASRSVQLLAGWAFATLGLARLELTCSPENRASQRVAERCGFVREGLLRSHLAFKGGRRDTLLFSLLPDELRTARPSRATPTAGFDARPTGRAGKSEVRDR